MLRLLYLVACFSVCTSAPVVTYTSEKGKLYGNGKELYLKGANWFGMETIELAPQGLWPHAATIEGTLDTLQEQGFNAIRLPLAIDSIMNNPKVSNTQVDGSPYLEDQQYLDILDIIITKAGEKNFLVLLANQRMEASEPDFPDIASPKDTIPALKELASRYCNIPSAWNVLGIDLKAEPKGKATWGTGDKSTDWDVMATEMGKAVLKECPDLLVFVEGVQNNIDGEKLEWGQPGGSLQGVKEHPIDLSTKLVYSAHVKSPTIDYKSPWFNAKDYPNNLPAIWDAYFGFVPKETGHAVIVGSWEVKIEDKKNRAFGETLAKYLEENRISSFYWAVNPNSADVGGLLIADWKTPEPLRFELLSDLPTSDVQDILAVNNVCKSTCDGNGECVDGQCECYAGWSGPQCVVCSQGDRTACNSFGTCQRDGTCACDDEGDGKYCLGEDCGDMDCQGEDAMCKGGACVCTYYCSGSDCTSCAANSTMLEGDDDILCSECKSATKTATDAAATCSSATLVAIVTLVLAIAF